MRDAAVKAVPCSVGVVCAYFWPENLGCAQHVTDVAKYLAQQGHRVDVFSAIPHYPRKSSVSCEGFAENIDESALTIKRAWVFDRSSGGLGIRLLNDVLFALQTAFSLLNGQKARDAILVVAPPVFSLAIVRILRPRIRVVAAVYDIESKLAQATGIVSSAIAARILDRIEVSCLNRADAVLALTPQMESALCGMGVSRPMTVVPIWPATTRHAPVASGRPPRLMYSGGLNKRHGIGLLPDLWSELHSRLPECELIVQGDGTERNLIQTALADVGGKVTFRPPVDRALLAQSLLDGDLQLVLTSGVAADFTIPSKAITALAAGVPFLTNAPANSALAEFAQISGAGVVVSSDNGSRLASAAHELLRSPNTLRTMARAGVEFVEREYDPETLLQTYERLLFGESLNSEASDRTACR